MVKEALMPVFTSVLDRFCVWYDLELAYNWHDDKNNRIMDCSYYESRYHSPL